MLGAARPPDVDDEFHPPDAGIPGKAEIEVKWRRSVVAAPGSTPCRSAIWRRVLNTPNRLAAKNQGDALDRDRGQHAAADQAILLAVGNPTRNLRIELDTDPVRGRGRVSGEVGLQFTGGADWQRKILVRHTLHRRIHVPRKPGRQSPLGNHPSAIPPRQSPRQSSETAIVL